MLDSDTAAARACAELLAGDAIGFDTESKPIFRKGEAATGPHLSERQLLYAANDAHVALRLYRVWRQGNPGSWRISEGRSGRTAVPGSGGGEGGVDQGQRQPLLTTARLGEVDLEAVDEDQQFVDLGDDAVLFGEGR